MYQIIKRFQNKNRIIFQKFIVFIQDGIPAQEMPSMKIYVNVKLTRFC